ncbi:hypothetical protein [Serratia sp. FGI94]|uniref:hypothetical protein n=1 Tax=Serratia sp. FGI94 TaxID=671990 RepID=UPI0002E71956|nr:hypothetical protein [Serratia sp. FGI94]
MIQPIIPPPAGLTSILSAKGINKTYAAIIISLALLNLADLATIAITTEKNQ